MEETKNTNKAREYLYSLTQKPIFLTTVEEESVRVHMPNMRSYLGASIEESSRFVIAINHEKPDTNESTFVHEVIHFILAYTKYPRFIHDENYARQNVKQENLPLIAQLVSRFSLSIEHPEVYRQMIENYNLDIESYFDGLLIQKIHRLKIPRPSSHGEQIFSDQQDIVEGIEYLYYLPHIKKKLLKIFSEKSPTAHQIILELNEEFGAGWAQSPDTLFVVANKILNRIIRYGESHNLGDLNQLWKSLRIIPQA